jgi:hypothetical protein
VNTQQLAEHIVLGHYGRRQHRKAARERADIQRQADFTRPRWWVLAHIETRADYKPGQFAQMVADRSPDNYRNWQEYLNESRTAYRATR